MSLPDDPWFIYEKSKVRFSARPVNAKGWAALIGCILLANLLGAALLPLAMRLGEGVAFILLPPIILGSIWLIAKIAIAKGRPAE